MQCIGNKKGSNLARKVKFTEIFVIAFIVILSLISIIAYNVLKSEITSSISVYGFIALFLLTSFVEVVPNFFNPIFGLAVAFTLGFDFYYSVLYCLLGVIFGGILGFEIGKRYGFRIVCVLSTKRTIEKIENLKQKYGNIAMTLAAILPIPYFPIVFGAFSIKRKDFLIHGLFMRILFVLAFAWLFKIGILNNSGKILYLVAYTLVLLTVVPIGWFLSWLCKDELVSDRKWLRYFLISVFIILSSIVLLYRNITIILSLLYLVMVLIIMLYLGKNKRFMKQ